MLRVTMVAFLILSSTMVSAGLLLGTKGPRAAALTHAAFTDAEFATGTIKPYFPPTCVFWANNYSNKDNFKITGGNNYMDGCAHSNYDFVANGNNNVWNKTIRYVTSFITNSNGHEFRQGVVKVPPEPFPYPLRLSDFAPGGAAAQSAASKGKYFHYPTSINTNLALLLPGLHFVEGSATLSGSVTGGNITVVATGKITVNAGDFNARAFTRGVLFMSNATGQNAIKFSGNGGTSYGVIYAINGNVAYAGNNGKYYGQIVGDTIQISSSNTIYIARSAYQLGGCPTCG